MKIISFNQAFQDITKEVTKIPRKEYLSHGQFPIVDQGDGEIAGYTNCRKGLYTEVPVVLFGDHTRVFKYINFPFFAGADGTKILKAKSGTDAHFGYYSFMQYPLISLGYSRHFKLLKERMFHTFDYATQLRIAAIMEWFVFRGYGGWGQPPSPRGDNRRARVLTRRNIGGWGQPPSPYGDNGRARVLTRRNVNHAI